MIAFPAQPTPAPLRAEASFGSALSAAGRDGLRWCRGCVNCRHGRMSCTPPFSLAENGQLQRLSSGCVAGQCGARNQLTSTSSGGIPDAATREGLAGGRLAEQHPRKPPQVFRIPRMKPVSVSYPDPNPTTFPSQLCHALHFSRADSPDMQRARGRPPLGALRPNRGVSCPA